VARLTPGVVGSPESRTAACNRRLSRWDVPRLRDVRVLGHPSRNLLECSEPGGDEIGQINRGVQPVVAEAGDGSLLRVERSQLQRGHRTDGFVVLVVKSHGLADDLNRARDRSPSSMSTVGNPLIGGVCRGTTAEREVAVRIDWSARVVPSWRGSATGALRSWSTLSHSMH